MGTAPLACASLQALAASPAFHLVAVVTQPDRPKGRDLQLQPSVVKRIALQLGQPVLQPESARNPEFLEQLGALSPGLIAVAAYGQILPPTILELPRYGCLNVHTSILPKYRGAAPIQWAILNGETETGVTIMRMDAGLDTGDIVAMEKTPITANDDAQTLHDRLASLGAALLVRTIPEYLAGRLTPRKQPEDGASYARKIKKEDGAIDWTQPAPVIWHRIRALKPWPGAFTHLAAPPRPVLLKVWKAEPAVSGAATPGVILSADRHGVVVGCGEGSLRISELQREGGRRLGASEFLAGCPLPPGTKLR